MPTQRYTRAARQRDERNYKFLLAGYPRDCVARECGLTEREVANAELRLEAEWSRTGENEVARRRLIISCGIIASESMRAWQRSRLLDLSNGESAGGVPIGDPRHLDRALRAFALQTKHIGLAPKVDDEPTPEAPPEHEDPSAATESAGESVAASTSSDAAPNSHFEPLPARLFANSPPSAPAIPKNILADVCSRAVTNGFASRKAK